MKFAAPLISSTLSVLATLSTQVQAQPVIDPIPKDYRKLGSSPVPHTAPLCKDEDPNTIKIKSDVDSQVFQDTYYTNRTVYVPRAEGLYLDSISFASDCGIAYCNKKDTGLRKRAASDVKSPKGSDCVVPTASISTFKCKSGKKGKVVVTVDETGNTSFEATDAVAYFGSWVVKGKDSSCVTAAKNGESTSPIDKDSLIVDCTNSLEYSCSDIPSGPPGTQD